MTQTIKFYFANQSFQFKIVSLLLAIIVLGAGLRIFKLEVTGLWLDEIHSAVGADPDKTIAEVIEYCKTDQPPVFFLMLHGWFKIFPYNDFYGRLLVVFTGLLGIVMMYFLGKEYKDQKVGLLSAFFTAINYFHVDFSRQERFYPLVFLFSALSYFFFMRIFKKPKFTNYVFYIIATSALLNTHYFGLVVFASQFILFAIVVLWKKITDLKFIVYSILSGVVVGLSFLYWLPVIVSDLGISQFHIQPLPWYFPVTYHWVYFRDVVTAAICGVLILVAIRRMFLDKKESINTDDLILLGWIVFGFLIPIAYSVLRIPMLEYKYSFIVVPAILLLVATGFDSIKNNTLKYILVVVLLLAFIINSFFIKSIYFRKPFEEWREVTLEIKKSDNANQVVLSNYAWYLRYYFKVYNLSSRPFEPMYGDMNALTQNTETVWVLIQTRYSDNGISKDFQDTIDKNYILRREVRFVDTLAKYYERR